MLLLHVYVQLSIVNIYIGTACRRTYGIYIAAAVPTSAQG